MSDEAATPPKKKCIKRQQKYRKDWEKNFKWVEADTNSKSKAYCKLCRTTLTSEIQVLKIHESSKKHKMQSTILKSQASVSNFLKAQTQTNSSVSRAEMKIAGFFTEHNISFRIVDHLIKLMQDIAPDSEIIKGMHMGRTKLTSITKNVIGNEYKKVLANKLFNVKFSILTDESTDISSQKAACIVVRYFDHELGKILSSFWELVQLYSDENETITAEYMYSCIINTFKKCKIPEENVIGFASDGCNVMMGKNNSVASRFKEHYPGIVIIKCICHSAHLCASEACKKLPRRCEDLARNIYNYFKCSAKRQHELKQFQNFLNLEMHKMLHPAQTRWLSLIEVVNRLIEQWDALKLYFTGAWLGDRLVATEHIYNDLSDPFMKLYFFFLSWFLQKFAEFNKYFQSEKVVITELNTKLELLYRDILVCYMERNFVYTTPINDIDPNDKSHFIPMYNMYMGINVMNQLNLPEIKKEQNLIVDFYKRCRNFMITACSEIKKRYSFNDPILMNIHFFAPNNALSDNFRNYNGSLFFLLNKTKRFLPCNVDMQIIDDQWRQLPLIKDYIKYEENVDIFWHSIYNFKNALGEFQFRHLATYVLALLSIPHSNAECERIFSKINLIKTKPRNKLICGTLNGLVLSSQCIKMTNSCVEFEPSKAMHGAFRVQMYDHKQNKQDNHDIEDVDDVLFCDL